MSTNKTLFIVDDDEDDLFFFEEALKRTDDSAHLIKVIESTEAIKILRGAPPITPDYIFLDLNMPRKSGRECLEDIRREPLLARVPVIIYTTSSSTEDRKELIKMGANHFITKFSDFKELCRTLGALLRNELKMDIPTQAYP